MSLAGRLMNVFATPGEVFDEVRAVTLSTANWLLPLGMWALVGAIAACLIFSQPGIQQQVREQQAKAMDKQVKAGKMTQAQADKTLEMVEKFTGPTMLKIFGSAGAVVGSFIHIFWWALVLWLVGRWILKAQFGYLKSLEVAGLASMIGVLGGILTMLLSVVLSRMYATPSLALALSDFDPTRKTHLAMGAANVFYFWMLGVMSIGLAKLSGVPVIRAAIPVTVVWVLQQTLLILVGLGQFAL